MNGLQKSDCCEVARSATNEIDGSIEESQERRRQAEGNTGEVHTRWTQSRVSVSQGLDRVRARAKHHARGSMIIVRYADDIVCGFEHEVEARRFRAELKERFKQFELTLHEQKTRLLQFGRFAAQKRQQRGMCKPETFDFLGFTHICGRARSGAFQLKRKTRLDRMRVKLKDIKEGLRRKMHESFAVQGQWLQRVYRGYCGYHAVPTNLTQLRAFRYHITVCWWRLLQRRSQKDRTQWENRGPCC